MCPTGNTNDVTNSLMSTSQPASGPENLTVVHHWGLAFERLIRAWVDTFQQGLPLFQRELLMQSSRGRTYIIRAVFASALFATALLYAVAATGTPIIGAAVRLPGQGRVILDALVWMLFGLIYIYGPATASGAITLEKERQTFVLLYLTSLTPWHIILEKFLSRLLPLLTILLLAMPLLVFAYTFGGVSPEMLGTSVWYLVVTAVQVIAVSVFSSTVSQRTTQAFLTTFGMLLVLYFGPVLIDIWLLDGTVSSRAFSTPGASQRTLAVMSLPSAYTSFPNQPPPAIPAELSLMASFPPMFFTIHYESAFRGGQFSWKSMLLAGVPALLTGLLSLCLARLMLFYRAFTEHRFQLLATLQRALSIFWIGRQYRAVEVNSQSSVLLSADLPGDQPITWREVTKGTQNWLPFLLVLEIPTLVLALWLARTGDGHPSAVSVEIFGLWAISALVLCVHTSSIINRERGQQTLELLLITPLTSAEIVEQKFNGTRRLMLICAAPLVTCLLFQAWWRAVVYVPLHKYEGVFIWWEYLVTSFVCVFLYFQIIGWIAMWAGLRNKNPTRATLDALGAVLCLCCIPQVLLMLPMMVLLPLQWLTGISLAGALVVQITPAVMIAVTEFADMRRICEVPLLPAVINLLTYGSTLIWLRSYVLKQADKLLGRVVTY